MAMIDKPKKTKSKKGDKDGEEEEEDEDCCSGCTLEDRLNGMDGWKLEGVFVEFCIYYCCL